MQHIMNLKIKGRGRSFYFIGKKGLAKDTYTSIDLSGLTDVDLKNISKSLATEVIEAKDMSASEAVDIVDSLIEISKPSSGSSVNVLDADQLKSITISDIKGLEERLNAKPQVALNALRLEGKNTTQLVEEISKAAVQAAAQGTIKIDQVEGLSVALSTKVSAGDKGVSLGVAGLDSSGRLQLQSSRSFESINGMTGPGMDFKIQAGSGIVITNDTWNRVVNISSNITSSPASMYQTGAVRLSTTPSDYYSPVAVGDNDPRLIDSRSPTGTCNGMDLEGTYPSNIAVKSNAITDSKLGKRVYGGRSMGLQEALTQIALDIDKMAQTTSVGQDPVVHTHHTVGLGNVLNEKQLVAYKNLQDLPNKDAAREVLGAVSIGELQGTATQLLTAIKTVDDRLTAHCNEDWVIPEQVIKPGSITVSHLSGDVLSNINTMIKCHESDLADVELAVMKLQKAPATTAKSVGLGEVVNAKQLIAHNNLEDLGDLKEAKKVLSIASMASQEKNAVDITGGKITVDFLTAKNASIQSGSITVDQVKVKQMLYAPALFVDNKQVVGERQSFDDITPYKGDNEEVKYLTNKVIELTKILKKHGLIGE